MLKLFKLVFHPYKSATPLNYPFIFFAKSIRAFSLKSKDAYFFQLFLHYYFNNNSCLCKYDGKINNNAFRVQGAPADGLI